MKTHLLQIAGLLHFCILLGSALVPVVLQWRKRLAASDLPLLMRQLFWVYGIFIVITIIGFGTLTLLNADAMAAGDPVARSLAAFIAIFWFVRLMIQWFLFDARPFLTNLFLKIGEHGLTIVFIYFTLIYGWTAFFPNL